MRKMKSIIAIILCLVLAVSLLSGCTGAPGQDGAPGKDGAVGKDGANGLTPYIGKNGNWWVGEQDTNVKAMGESSVTPEMFGAVGDGKADDTAAILSALKTGKSVFLSQTYRVNELDCTGLEKVVMYGKENITARLSNFPVDEDTYTIIFEGNELFKNAPSAISLAQIRFYAKNAGVLIKTKISGSWVKQCNFTYFGGLFMGGMDNQCQISENTFFQMAGTFATDCANSVISNNYLNSRLPNRTTLFTGTNFTGMLFQGNSVDYSKITFGEYQNWEGNCIEGNVFDSIFRVFDTKHKFNDTSITGNRFIRIYYTDFEGQWKGYTDNQMDTEDWRVFTINEQCDRVNISSNTGDATVALKVHAVNNPTDTYIDVSGIKGKVEFEYSNKANAAGSSIFVENLDYITVDSLPSAALYDTSGATLTSFNKQHVFCQGSLYINNNGTWLKLNGA